MALRILLVDDHHLVRAGIRALIKQFPEYEVVGEAASGNEAIRLTTTHKPDIVLLGIASPERNGLKVMACIFNASPGTRVIILSLYSTEAYVLRVLRAGALGYLSPSSSVSELELALEAAARGEVFASSSVPRQRVDHLKRHRSAQLDNLICEQEPAAGLTTRQRQVLQLIAEGYATKEIAEKMGLSAKTVKTYRVQLMRELGIHRVASLVRYAIRVGMVNADA